MEENSEKENKYCRMCGWGSGHFALRWILGMVILLIAFCLGIMAGRLHGGYGRGHFGRFERGGRLGYPRPMMQGYQFNGYPGMMQGASGSATQAQPATTTPAKK